MGQRPRRSGLFLFGVALFGSGGIFWVIVEWAGTLDFLLGLSAESPVAQWLSRYSGHCLMVIGVVMMALYRWPAPLIAIEQSLSALRKRWRMRHWTDAGLNWIVRPESHQLLRDGKMAAILSISPLPDSELPQPLEVIVTCVGRISGVSSVLHADAEQVGNLLRSGDVTIGAPDHKEVRLVLYSPKLLPPSRWDLTLISAGNAEIKVVDVRRAPRKGEAPKRPKPPAGPLPSRASGQSPPP